MKTVNSIAVIAIICCMTAFCNACNKGCKKGEVKPHRPNKEMKQRTRNGTKLRTHIVKDTLVVDNYYYNDVEGNKYFIMFNLSLQHDEYKLSPKQKMKAEKMRRDRLHNPKRFCVDFIGTIGGYKVSAVFHPDDTDNTVGMAMYHFKSRTNDFTINSAYYWRNWDSAFNDNADKVKFNGDKGSVPVDTKAVQGDGKKIVNIESTPFVIKDVDFDGEKEILFRCGGYNRYYWNVFKVIGKGKAALMNGAYDNIVYGEGEDAYTEFNYKHKTIYITENMGCCKLVEQTFIRTKAIDNKLNPMKELYHIESGIDRGLEFHRYYKNGTIIRYEDNRYPDNEQVTVKAIYNLHSNVLRLDSVLLYDKNNKMLDYKSGFRKR